MCSIIRPMKISLKNLIIGILAVIAAVILLVKSGNRNLPDGKIIQTPPLNIPDSQITPQVIPGKPRVEISTSKGIFVLELRPDLSPKSTANFLSKWVSGYCNGKTFHRVEDWVVQGCDPKGDGTGGQDILPTETSSQNFTVGSVGVARKVYPVDKSNDSQFFIVKKPSFFLDGQYTYLGQIVSGMDIINSLTPGDTILDTVILTK